MSQRDPDYIPESDYYGIYFFNILCVCDFPTYYPKSTLKYLTIRKNFNIFRKNPIYYHKSTLRMIYVDSIYVYVKYITSFSFPNFPIFCTLSQFILLVHQNHVHS